MCASDFAACVLPTPASPSSNNGCGKRMAQNKAVARPSSARYPSPASRAMRSSGDATSSATDINDDLLDYPPDNRGDHQYTDGYRDHTLEHGTCRNGTEIESLGLLDRRWCRCR